MLVSKSGFAALGTECFRQKDNPFHSEQQQFLAFRNDRSSYLNWRSLLMQIRSNTPELCFDISICLCIISKSLLFELDLHLWLNALQ